MKIEINLKDAIVFVLIIAVIVIGAVKFARVEASLQNAALIKAVNDQGAVIQQIVSYINGKAPGATGTPANAPTPASQK